MIMVFYSNNLFGNKINFGNIECFVVMCDIDFVLMEN